MFWIAQTLSCYDALVISMFGPRKTNHIALELQELENVFFFFFVEISLFNFCYFSLFLGLYPSCHGVNGFGCCYTQN